MNHNHEVDITKFDDRDYSVTCHQCGKTFEATRSDAAFCSARCRVRNSREPQKKANAIETLRYAGISANDIANRYPRSKDVFEAMLKLQKEIALALAKFE